MDAIDKFYRCYNENNLELWDEALSEDYVGHVNTGTIPDRETGKGFVTHLLTAFPDMNYQVDDRVEQGAKVVTRWSATATHTGDFAGIPASNKQVTMIGITIFHLQDGKISELWNIWDQAGLMQQLTG